MASLEQFLRRFGALTVAIVSVAVIWWVWDQANPVPVIHDEASYLLQADIFASGRWTAPTPALPEFFEQPHVQIAPAVASKYPPGHALLLTLGALLGWHALVPLVLTGITAALLFALAMRVTNPWVALFTWAVWIFSPMVLRFQPSYLSELTTTPLVLGSWMALLRWRERHAPGWLLLLALLVGWGAITRPLTMLVFALPIGVVVLRDVMRARRWRDFGLAVLVGVSVLALLPVWSQRTTGSWRLSPVEKYRLDYLPFDKIGFTADTTRPRRHATMSPVLVETYDYFLDARKEQSLAALPITAVRRFVAIATGLFQGGRLPLLVLAIIGLVVMPRVVAFGVVSAFLLVLAHLPYAHWPGWTVYYLEAAPVAALLCGLGLWHLGTRYVKDRLPALVLTSTAAVGLVGALGASHWRDQHRGPAGGQLHRQLAQAIRTMPKPGILFVRYSPRIMHNPAIVRNFAYPDSAGMWIVHDLGAHNEALLRLAPGRVSHHLDVDRMVRSATSP
jgi:hypothetical protein